LAPTAFQGGVTLSLPDYSLKQEVLERELYLAIRQAVFLDLFEEPIGKVLLENNRVRLIVFDPHREVIVKWIP